MTLPLDTLAGFDTQLAELDALQLRRQRRVVEAVAGPRLRVDGADVLAFCSNDYLGLAQHPALIEAAQQAAAQYGVGATASPLVCGHQAPHAALEQELAEFAGLPRALYFGSGYVANVGLLPALVARGDAVFCDALNHACLIDGARLSGAERHIYPHRDTATLAVQLAASPGRRKLVVTDTVFSMDGDIAPLPELLALCERHDAWLMVDDAHGFGVLGPQGRGSIAHLGISSPRLIYMATLGKAAGVSGAFVAGQDTAIEWLMQRARSYIFATATPAMVVQAVRASLKVIARDDWRREQLQKLVARLRQGTAGLPWRHVESPTAIQPLIVGSNAGAMAAMAALLEQGLWVPAIRPPTVPEGSARLRISLSALHSTADIDRLIAALHGVAKSA
ncbi:MAG TPA: 8-amino-7-oxononanoate synthase [Rhizobacter sp.]|nr:8-amino-7-oxononanoate synthase [Rhizobacter sp.]